MCYLPNKNILIAYHTLSRKTNNFLCLAICPLLFAILYIIINFFSRLIREKSGHLATNSIFTSKMPNFTSKTAIFTQFCAILVQNWSIFLPTFVPQKWPFAHFFWPFFDFLLKIIHTKNIKVTKARFSAHFYITKVATIFLEFW